jgi:hypothetical protein
VDEPLQGHTDVLPRIRDATTDDASYPILVPLNGFSSHANREAGRTGVSQQLAAAIHDYIDQASDRIMADVIHRDASDPHERVRLLQLTTGSANLDK